MTAKQQAIAAVRQAISTAAAQGYLSKEEEDEAVGMVERIPERGHAQNCPVCMGQTVLRDAGKARCAPEPPTATDAEVESAKHLAHSLACDLTIKAQSKQPDYSTHDREACGPSHAAIDRLAALARRPAPPEAAALPEGIEECATMLSQLVNPPGGS
jgi:hypothetical protein